MRTRRLHTRHTPAPTALPASFLATIWPDAKPARWSPLQASVFRQIWATGRSVAALCWPTRLDRRQHPILWVLARIVWTVAGLTIYTTTITVGLAALLTRPATWVMTHAAGYRLVTAGWSPPLTDVDLHRLVDPDRALFDEDYEHNQRHQLVIVKPQAVEGSWVDPVERERTREQAAEARHERQTAALEALAHQPTPPAPTHTAPPATARARQPVSFQRWVLRALITLSLISATGLIATAWALAALSAAGTIGEPPTQAELIDSINARTEQRANDIANRLNETRGTTTP